MALIKGKLVRYSDYHNYEWQDTYRKGNITENNVWMYVIQLKQKSPDVGREHSDTEYMILIIIYQLFIIIY